MSFKLSNNPEFQKSMLLFFKSAIDLDVPAQSQSFNHNCAQTHTTWHETIVLCNHMWSVIKLEETESAELDFSSEAAFTDQSRRYNLR